MTPLPRSDAKGGAEHLTLAYTGTPAPQSAQAAPSNNALRDILAGQPFRLTLAALGGAGLAVLLMEAFSSPPPQTPPVPAAPPTATAPPLPQAVAPISLVGDKKFVPGTAEAPGKSDSARTPAATPNPTQAVTAKRTPPPGTARATASKPVPSAGHLGGESEENPKEEAITIRHSSTTARINPTLLQAWNAFQAGDMRASLAGYQRAAHEEPNNTDALHGLAAIALRQDRQADAAATYRRILELTPQDALAQATLVTLLGTSGGQSEESRLQSILARTPQSAAAHFSLGNQYAQEGRWADAEQAYFRALALAPNNPDYRFNLAISLDQLGQAKEAAKHYRGALAQAENHPAAFDPAQASARLAELEP
jgi:Flp pilus assembly protein TadD